HGVADLTETMPDGAVEAEPVGVRVQARCLPHGDATGGTGVYRSRSAERSSVGRSTGAERVADALHRESVEPADGLGTPRFRRSEAPTRFFGVLRPQAA